MKKSIQFVGFVVAAVAMFNFFLPRRSTEYLSKDEQIQLVFRTCSHDQQMGICGSFETMYRRGDRARWEQFIRDHTELTPYADQIHAIEKAP